MTEETRAPGRAGDNPKGSGTIIQMVDARAAELDDRAIMRRKQDGQWVDISWRELSDTSKCVARGLLRLGLEKGDCVSILSENRPEWVFCDLGIQAMEGIGVPLYWTLTPAQIEYILDDCQARAIFVSNPEYLDRILKVRSSLPRLETIVIFDPPEGGLPEGVIPFADLVADGRSAPPEIWETLGRCLSSSCADDTVTIIYTSGTTGEPKGVMLTNRNFLSNVEAVLKRIEVTSEDSCLSFLPLSHVFERIALYLFLYVGGTINYAESIEALIANMSEVHPTILVSVPRIYEKAYARIQDTVRQGSILKRWIFRWAVGVGSRSGALIRAGQPLGAGLEKKKKIADKLVFTKLRQTFGGRMRLMISGGAPLASHLAEFFHSAGLIILEGYGLTETSPVIAANVLEDLAFGSVGKPLPGVEVKIAKDGEILTRGPHVMKGYFNRPDDTAEAIDGEGWFHTGDIGHLDEEGHLVITDRKKSIIVTAGGKNIAPAALENALSSDKFISQGFVYGDGKPYIVALIVPDWERAESYATEKKLTWSDRQGLSQDPAIIDLVQSRVDRAQADLARFEQIKKFRILAEEFTQEKGEVTPTLKLKRKEISRHYFNELETLYQD